MEGNRGQCGRGCGVSDTPDWALVAQKIHQDCRKLERELAEVTKQRDELQAIIDEKCRFSTLCREMRMQRDLLIEGLEKLASCEWVITLPDRMDAVRNIANETLNKIKP